MNAVVAGVDPIICYLCGADLSGACNSDHIPPQQLWSPTVRKAFNVSQLVTVQTHKACNSLYSRDEEYFARILSTASYDSPTARSIVEHGFAKAREGKSLGLLKTIIENTEERPGGLVLPGNREVMRVDGNRLRRVAWKIVRGLWFLEKGTSLPIGTPCLVDMQEPENRDTPKHEEFWNKVRAQPSLGAYQGVFAHKHLHYQDDGESFHGWAMLLWNRFIIYCMHFDPDKPPDMSKPRDRSNV